MTRIGEGSIGGKGHKFATTKDDDSGLDQYIAVYDAVPFDRENVKIVDANEPLKGWNARYSYDTA
jgi:hypothetical protein